MLMLRTNPALTVVMMRLAAAGSAQHARHTQRKRSAARLVPRSCAVISLTSLPGINAEETQHAQKACCSVRVGLLHSLGERTRDPRPSLCDAPDPAAYPRGPYRFVNREYFIITYRTDPEKLRALVPAPLEIEAPLVKYEFVRMPDSTGFGDYTESGQVIPVSFGGHKGNYTLCMFLNDHPPIAAGREVWGFPKKLGSPTLRPKPTH